MRGARSRRYDFLCDGSWGDRSEALPSRSRLAPCVGMTTVASVQQSNALNLDRGAH
jgi:hypothetical protein